MTDRERLIADFRSKYYEAIGDWEPEVYLSIDEARNILQALDSPTVGGWISVKDRLPEESGRYLRWFGNNKNAIGASIVSYFSDLRYFGSMTSLERYENVTHWMPLPEPPKESSRR